MVSIKKVKEYFIDVRNRLVNIESRIILLEKSMNVANEDIENFHECSDQWWGGYSYAQHGDDLIVLNIFHTLGIEKFTYIDVGANHPYRISNTALMYELGHRGINIEANPNLISLFHKYRPEDTNLNVGVGIRQGTMPFYMIDDYSGRNTFSREAAESFVKKHPEFKIRKVENIKVLTLEDIVREYCNGVFPDFMSMDVEGLDYQILSSINFEGSAPKIIDVEAEYSAGDTRDKIRELLEKKGYFAYIRAGVNIIFVREEYRDKLI